MSRRVGRALAMTLAAGLALSAAGAAMAAPVGALKQYKVPTANSHPRGITTGSDGNRWFTEGTEVTGAPAKIARITPDGTVTEFAANCSSCILTDVAQGPDGILYITSNNPILLRFDVSTETFLDPAVLPKSNANSDNVAVSATDVWTTDFNNNSLWRYDIAANTFTEVPGVA